MILIRNHTNFHVLYFSNLNGIRLSDQVKVIFRWPLIFLNFNVYFIHLFIYLVLCVGRYVLCEDNSIFVICERNSN